jgi:hypothetical protein
MRDSWEVLHRGGVPLAGERADVACPSATDLARAARDALAGNDGAPREREALGAWLRAWAWHWPTSFAASFGDDSEAILAWARAATSDHGRYLKLRRLATARLACLL